MDIQQPIKNTTPNKWQDWHVHDFVSHDASGHVEDYVRAALEKGVDLICFANHPERKEHKEAPFTIDVDKVIDNLKKEKDEICRCREKYGPDIRLYQGIELENRKSLKEVNQELLEKYSFDIVIGSCHLVGDNSISSKRNLSLFEETDEETLYSQFFDGTLELLNSFPFDILGHFDIVKRYGVYYYGEFKVEKYQERIREIFSCLKEKNIGLEINTSGFFQHPGEPYPSEDLACQAREWGVPFIVTGSDAHRPEDLARGFERLEHYHLYQGRVYE